MDLAFPHHENERAQAVGLGRRFARHWVHNGWVVVEGEKMSKSLGNFTSLTDLLDRADARAYRLLVLRAHYRSPLEVTPSTVEQAENALQRLDELARRFELPAPAPVTAADAPGAGADPHAVASFVARMDDDLDTPGALAGIFDLARRAHSAADAGDTETGQALARTAAILCGALGLALGGTAPRSTRPPPRSWLSATPPGPPGTTGAPTPSGPNWRGAAGWSRTAPRARACTGAPARSAPSPNRQRPNHRRPNPGARTTGATCIADLTPPRRCPLL